MLLLSNVRITLSYLAVVTVLLLFDPACSFTRTVSQDAMDRCHRGVRDGRVRCGEYANEDKRSVREAKHRHKRQQAGEGPPECDTEAEDYALCQGCRNGTITDGTCPERPDGRPDGGDPLGEPVDYPTISQWCLNVEWGRDMNATNNHGNCMNMTTDDTYRYITSNNVPNFYVNSYCPIGLGFGYCVAAEIESGSCFFEDLMCGDDNGVGSNDFGDVWVAQEDNYKIPLEGNPTRSDRPGDMYDATKPGGAKTNGAAQAVATNGIGVLGPNDAGDVSIDEAKFQLACGGHVTPPMGNSNTAVGPSGPPKYHFHKSPECQPAFTNPASGVYNTGSKPYEHAELMAWAIDGFGVYAYQDVDGSAPIVDECGGHFGPVDTGEVVYHYHSRPIVPYHLACQGPSLMKCNTTQSGTNYCHPGCGYELCVQPGTSEEKLRAYLAKWDDTWLDKYSVNDYKDTTCTSNTSNITCNMFIAVLLAHIAKYLFA